MLTSLIAGKYGDFSKLSHGHHEWGAIEQALRNKDKGVLKVSARQGSYPFASTKADSHLSGHPE